MSSSLNVWMNGELVGAWTIDRGADSFVYAESWLQSDKVRSLSLSLPITTSGDVQGAVVGNYFDNLLPDNDRIRDRIRRRFNKDKSDAFSLLEAIGRDCVGAVQLLPPDAEPKGWNTLDYKALTNAEIRELLRAVPAEPHRGLEPDNDAFFRISLAGAQEKTALTKINETWCLPLGSTPTTHILKLPLGTVGGSRMDLSNSLENEWLCAQILHHLGLPAANTDMVTFGDQTVLVVERFDRKWMGKNKWIARLPQEDFCQALGLPSSKKYEADGGPGTKDCLQLLDGSADRADPLVFLLAQLSFWLLAATDGHAKNHSIFLDRDAAYSMTPLYDVISFWPYIGDGNHQLRWRSAKLAMAIHSKNAHYELYGITTRHWHDLAMRNGGAEIWSEMIAFIDRVEPVLEQVDNTLSKDFPTRVWHTIRKGIRKQLQVFRSGLPLIKG